MRDKKDNINSLTTLKVALVKGQRKTIRLNWPIDEASARNNAAENTYLPLDGVNIAVFDKDTIAPTQSIYGKMVNGEFTFTVPRNNYEYYIEVTASHKTCSCITNCNHSYLFNVKIITSADFDEAKKLNRLRFRLMIPFFLMIRLISKREPLAA